MGVKSAKVRDMDRTRPWSNSEMVTVNGYKLAYDARRGDPEVLFPGGIRVPWAHLVWRPDVEPPKRWRFD